MLGNFVIFRALGEEFSWLYRSTLRMSILCGMLGLAYSCAAKQIRIFLVNSKTKVLGRTDLMFLLHKTGARNDFESAGAKLKVNYLVNTTNSLQVSMAFHV